jgi:C4-dicarboxylate transporter DctM subunit
MSQIEIGIIGCVALVVLILIGIHIGYTMIIVGFIGLGLIGGWPSALGGTAILAFDKMNYYHFSVLPMFLLMGTFVSQGGIAKDAYQMARAWFGQFKGGLAIATIGASGLFAAVSGSSLAGSLVMGKVAYPEMRRAGYAMSLSAGVISIGGTLGILIPPSMSFVIIGILSDLSIGQLFMAGILPGILVVIFYMATVAIVCKVKPQIAPTAAQTTWKEKWLSVRLTWPVVLLFLLVMGGIYSGIFTATEAGAIGAFGALVIPLAKRQLGAKAFWNSLMDALKMTAMIVILLVGAFIFNDFLAITQIPNTLSEFLCSLPISRYYIYVIILIFYIIVGMFFDITAIVILTVPIIYPVVQALGFDLIWFSVIVVRLMEIGMITPPYGINLFGILGVIDAPLDQIYRGVIPFIISDMLNLVVLSVFPVISTFLPDKMM